MYVSGEFDYLGLNTTMGMDFGNGYVVGIFVGAEKYVLNRISVSLDFGSYYIYLKHKIFPISEESVDFILNFLVNYYFM